MQLLECFSLKSLTKYFSASMATFYFNSKHKVYCYKSEENKNNFGMIHQQSICNMRSLSVTDINIHF